MTSRNLSHFREPPAPRRGYAAASAAAHFTGLGAANGFRAVRPDCQSPSNQRQALAQPPPGSAEYKNEAPIPNY
jgi:hypothetical protein